MKISVNDDHVLQLEEVFNEIILRTPAGEKMVICMRDSGFEFKYQNTWYIAQEGKIEKE